MYVNKHNSSTATFADGRYKTKMLKKTYILTKNVLSNFIGNHALKKLIENSNK